MGAGHHEDGTSLLELLLVVSLSLLLMAISLPAATQTVDTSRATHAAGYVGSLLRASRQRAVLGAASTGLVFDMVRGRWTFRVCRDLNRNGLRRADIVAGRDRCDDTIHDLAAIFPGVSVDVDPRLPGPEGDPPSTDPVKFGASDIASFSPAGSGTAGSVFLRSGRGVQYVVRVGNVGARTRILRYDPGTRRWEAE